MLCNQINKYQTNQILNFPAATANVTVQLWLRYKKRLSCKSWKLTSLILGIWYSDASLCNQLSGQRNTAQIRIATVIINECSQFYNGLKRKITSSKNKRVRHTVYSNKYLFIRETGLMKERSLSMLILSWPGIEVQLRWFGLFPSCNIAVSDSFLMNDTTLSLILVLIFTIIKH